VRAKYSVIVTVKNRQPLLNRCLQTVLWQDYTDFECVVVDYGSDPPAVVPNDPRMRVVRIEPPDDGWNGCIALNAGLANAAAERVVLLNCDCLMAPDLLRVADALLAERGETQQTYWQRFDLSKAGLAAVKCIFAAGRLANPRRCFRPGFVRFLERTGLARRHPCSSYGDFLVIKKQPLIELGGFDEAMAGWGQMDVDMKERLEALGYPDHWGMEMKLIHQYHPPQTNKHATVGRNLALSRRALAEGQLVRNGGPGAFEKYLVSGETESVEAAECMV
jgi:GT2 family glycosyltransferase